MLVSFSNPFIADSSVYDQKLFHILSDNFLNELSMFSELKILLHMTGRKKLNVTCLTILNSPNIEHERSRPVTMNQKVN
jgi:hypothetical protein